MTTKVAIPIWKGHVSPVMDTACRLLIVEIMDGREVSRTIIELPKANASHRAGFISDQGIDLLICGAISQQFDQMLNALGIKTKSWFRGDVGEVMAAFIRGVLHSDNFLLPGCGRRHRRERGRRGGRRDDRGTHKPCKED